MWEVKDKLASINASVWLNELSFISWYELLPWRFHHIWPKPISLYINQTEIEWWSCMYFVREVSLLLSNNQIYDVYIRLYNQHRLKSSRKCTMKKLKRLYWLRKSSLMFCVCFCVCFMLEYAVKYDEWVD